MPEPNFPNRTLYHGDKLAFLRGMNSETINLIATDPPFNKSKDFHATPDSLAAGSSFQDRWSWRDDIHDDWLIQIQRDNPDVWHVINAAKNVYGDDMGAFICWLGVRILEMHRILKPAGSLYLHIDHTAHAYAKALLDAVFGKENFRNEIVWAYTGPSNTLRWFPRKHDTLLFYVKSDEARFHRDAVRIPYSEETLARRGRVEGEQSIIAPSVETTGQRDKAQVEELFGSGKVPEDWWSDVPILTNQVEKTGYPTQKPLALYERIIKASSNPGDWVLDPFCGCATTPIAAEKLGRKWVGMDIWDGAHEVVLKRIEDNRQLLTEPNPQIHYITTPPVRTDDGEEAVLYLQTPAPRARRHPPPRSQHGKLLIDIGPFCQGCGRNYGFDTRVLEVDHIRPRSDGGSDAYDNLTLLCPPCNKEKRDRRTLTGLQDDNRKNGHLTTENERNIRHGRARTTRRRRR